MEHLENDVDVVIVGGGAAGLSAALLLGRSVRRVLVCDGGAPRNAPAVHSHSFFTRDGESPLEMLRIGREQLAIYEGVRIVHDSVVDIKAEGNGFTAVLGNGDSYHAGRVLLATGVADELPPIEGIRELWGKSVMHCPYCHGWEIRGEPIAVCADGDQALESVILLRAWSQDVVLCTNGSTNISAGDRDRLAAGGIPVYEEPILRLEGTDGTLERITFVGGESILRHALFLRPMQRQRSDLATRLGCEFTDDGKVKVDPVTSLTSVPRIYAVGDMATMMQQVVVAAAMGAQAAMMMNNEIIREEARL